MKSRIFRSSVAAVCLAALAWPLAAAAADNAGTPAAGGPGTQLRQRLGANQDGQADHPRLRAAILKKFDTNGDGKLDEQERAAAREAIKARLQQRRAEAGQK